MVNTMMGNWHIALKEPWANFELLCIEGIGINGNDVDVKLVAKNILTVKHHGGSLLHH